MLVIICTMTTLLQYNYIYLLQEREFVNSNQTIYKIGKSKQENNKRMNQYPKCSKLLFQIECNDCDLLETQLIAEFKNTYVQRADIGTEYFEGDKESMMNMIFEYRKNIDSKHREIKQTHREINELSEKLKELKKEEKMLSLKEQVIKTEQKIQHKQIKIAHMNENECVVNSIENDDVIESSLEKVFNVPAYIHMLYNVPNSFINQKFTMTQLYDVAQQHAKTNLMSSNFTDQEFSKQLRRYTSTFIKRTNTGIVYIFPSKNEYLKKLFDSNEQYYRFVFKLDDDIIPNFNIDNMDEFIKKMYVIVPFVKHEKIKRDDFRNSYNVYLQQHNKQVDTSSHQKFSRIIQTYGIGIKESHGNTYYTGLVPNETKNNYALCHI